MKTPVNELERALRAAARSESGRPAMFRKLLEEKLWCLMPYHPEMEGTLELAPGSPVTFTTWMMEGGEVVPLFTSPEQLKYAIRVRRDSTRAYTLAELQGRVLMQILAEQDKNVTINPHSELAELLLEPQAVRRLADGSIFQTVTRSEQEQSMPMTILDPADYPTTLVQPVFEFIRQHEAFRAAWVFGEGLPATFQPGRYRMSFWMEPREERLEQELGMVMLASMREDLRCGMTMMSTEQAQSQEWTRHVAPFFRRE